MRARVYTRLRVRANRDPINSFDHLSKRDAFTREANDALSPRRNGNVRLAVHGLPE